MIGAWPALLAAAASTALLIGCSRDESAFSVASANEPSPNASILPQPLAPGTESGWRDAGRGGLPADAAGRLSLPEASVPPPEPLREDVPMPRDTLTSRDGVGVTLEAKFAWTDLPAAAAVPEAHPEAIQKARDKTALGVLIDLAQAGRMRFTIASVAFPLPKNSEIRSATQHYGHVLVWPDANAYRVLMPGTIRALLAERRADVTPLTRGKAKPVGTGGFLGLETERTEVTGALGRVMLEQSTQPIAGGSGALLCRLLLELIAVQPQSSVCSAEATPLKAEFRWLERGRLQFEVTSLTRRTDLPIGQLYVPPAGAEFKAGELPPQAAGLMLTQAELARFRARPTSNEQPSPDAPGEGIAAVNRTDLLRYVLLDGVPIAWVKPRSEQYVIGPPPGRYSVAWRDFLGTELQPAITIGLPARVTVGAEPDAGSATAQ
jgi:hypothetical protein